MITDKMIEEVRRAHDEALANETFVNGQKAAYNAADNMAFGIALQEYGYKPGMNLHQFMKANGRWVTEFRGRLLWRAGL